MIFDKIIQQHCHDICVLLETHLSGASLDQVRWQFVLAWSTYVVESRGLSGRIIVTWWCSSVGVDAVHKYEQQIALIILSRLEVLVFCSMCMQALNIGSEGCFDPRFLGWWCLAYLLLSLKTLTILWGPTRKWVVGHIEIALISESSGGSSVTWT